MALSAKMGSSQPYLQFGAYSANLSTTTTVLNAALVKGTSGPAIALKFSAPESQTNAAFTAYMLMTAKTGSPTAITAEVFDGPSGAMDPQRPSTAASIGSVVVDVSGQTASTWTTFAITSLSLVAGQTYWLVIHNATGTPASNHATYQTRGWNGNLSVARLPLYTTADGFATDPSVVSTSSEGLVVMKTSAGSLLGSPFYRQTGHASNANDRGNRYRFDASVVVTGVFNTINSSLITSIKLYQGATEVASVTMDRSGYSNAQMNYFNSPVTLTAGLDYDLVLKYSGSSSTGEVYDAGASPPADVAACFPTYLSQVDGATPGSYTAAAGFYVMALLIDNFPAASGGTSGGSYCFIG